MPSNKVSAKERLKNLSRVTYRPRSKGTSLASLFLCDVRRVAVVGFRLVFNSVLRERAGLNFDPPQFLVFVKPAKFGRW